MIPTPCPLCHKPPAIVESFGPVRGVRRRISCVDRHGGCKFRRYYVRNSDDAAIEAWNNGVTRYHLHVRQGVLIGDDAHRCPACKLMLSSDGKCIDCPGRHGAVADLAMSRRGESTPRQVTWVRG